MAEGQCNCSAVQFTIEGNPADVYVCHCSICQKWTGHNGIAVTIVPNEAFRWLSGEEHIGRWKKPDADWLSCFCRICGSTLPGPNDAKHMFVPAGVITSGGEELRVSTHIWVNSRACWDVIGDNGRQHPEAYQG